ncbi:hypothetical protein BCR33DRAFT_717691 [Rhizoclosmatium globosum]|uniref:Uncharacterized protein n=1 Tax=Rhizoclosmatium globosum TaxID=329046 RepID=A0A1Y2CAX6_9FUNG|nr:hypothetical protein BCR33DRAFT_717691 [Rhizoclosmatium globosum]|eukprot:ORY43485.1 hypothetical protein BCR33DRAFT_717691 [Rhizoclosmatium globosum]
MDFNTSKPEPYIASIMTAVSVFLLLGLIYFIIVCEIYTREKELSLKTIFTPFSSLLILMITCQTGVYACEIFAFSEKAYRWTREYAELFAVQTWFIVLQEASYLFYSYLRAAPLFEDVFPRIAPALALGMKLMPILFVCQGVIGVARVVFFDDPEPFEIIAQCDQFIPVLIAVCMLTFDITSLVTFTTFLKRTSVAEKMEDKQFLIISHHGIAAVVVCFLIIVCYAITALFGSADALLLGFLFSTIMYLLLFRMKAQERIRSLNGSTAHRTSASV